MFDSITEWLMQPTVYIAVGAITIFILVKILVSFGISMFKKHIIDADKKQ